MEVMIFSTSPNASWALPFLLSRAGFDVDVVTTSRLLKLSKFVRHVYIAGSNAAAAELVSKHVRARVRPYDWIIAAEDETLTALIKLEQETGAPPNLTPILAGKSREHLCSKIGISHILSANAIKTPPFRVARNCEEAVAAARDLRYPVMLKVDASSGGRGVFACRDDAAIAALRRIFTQPVLVQKQIVGTEIDLSSIFLGGDLVHFSYSIIRSTAKRFGPSVLRSYVPLGLVEQAVFDELSKIGHTLGAHGLTTISCIDAADGTGRYYIEADMRPNVWTDFAVFYGEDPARRIRDWFSDRVCLTRENAASATLAPPLLTIPYFLRMKAFDMLLGRYDVWKFVPNADTRVVRRLLISKMVLAIFVMAGRWLLPPTLRGSLRRPLDAAGFPPS